MNAADLKAKLITDGIPESMVDGLVKQYMKANQPKKEKAAKKNSFFSGGSTRAKKTPTEVEVTVRCECCGTVEVKTMIVDLLPDSPKTQKVATSLCSKCPEVLRRLSINELVSVILLKCHPAVSIHNNTNVMHVHMASKFTPEEVVKLTVNHG